MEVSDQSEMTLQGGHVIICFADQYMEFTLPTINYLILTIFWPFPSFLNAWGNQIRRGCVLGRGGAAI